LNPLFIPVIGPGETRFMPVSIYDVARVFSDSLEHPETIGKVYEVGGPQTFTLNEIYREIAAAVGKPGKPLVHMPLWWGRFLAARFEAAARRGFMDAPPLTRDQLKSLAVDNTGDTAPTLAAFGGTWREFRSGIREYLGGKRANTRAAIGEEVHLERVDVIRIR
jgi:NADH dehydrogenase